MQPGRHDDHRDLARPGHFKATEGDFPRQIANSTKIGVHYLEGIEHGEFAKLPGGLHNTSYIRQYARAIGFPRTISCKPIES
jgi:hypothetical protein